MQAWRFWRESTRHFFQHWGSYVTLVFITNLAISYVAVPAFTWLTAALMKWQHVPYVSYTNIGSIALRHPLAIIGLLLILLAIITLIYWQFAYLLLGIMNIRNGRPQTSRAVLGDVFRSLVGASPSTFLFFIGYFVVIIPFGSELFSTPLLNKAKIPAFIVTYLMANPLWAVFLGIFYVAAAYIGIRLIAVLPLMMLDGYHSHEAIRLSWQRTRRHFWAYFSKILVTLAIVTVMVTLIYGLIYLGQLGFDRTGFGLAAATFNLFLMEIITEFIVCYSTVIFMMVVLSSHDSQQQTPLSLFSFREPARTKLRTRLLIISGLTLISALLVVFNLVYLNGLAMTKPLTIAHRGVDNGNGVQNTIPAMVKTSKERPDYVEMDIRMTKDHQFVVMHDGNLKSLAGLNRSVASMTLRQLTKVTVTENGYQAKIPSFNHYLNTAIKHHQKLLIEIKTGSADTPDLSERFYRQFGQRILTNHEQVHTLSYKVMDKLKKEHPQLFVSYIMPYNLTFPRTRANAYTMESTTLNDSFVDQANREHKKVYAWDIDDVNSLDQMMFMGANGVITNNLGLIQQEIKDNTDHPSYANLLLTFMNDLSLETQTQ
ncbi:glycerophosphodiester phosphodiesterase [Levilactobacillus brevis]|uniref:Membrane domain of membrane-anchored glycerophosphoryl diester phosphodiesterase n=3 Tax=Levilactobacillus brevis TaxID=1580 RepID=Q03U33_LEVBA|nr:glycerophosphodiester phosphodiesterase [Levilactobacillus brevis]MBL3536159.1 glycerophosphodiester phosphodiesterase [Lactobacillus sp. GPR40-2]MBL3629053.1 glycerophosphodiester phosphodiesterase [Lactobacillus sp. GPB7-4]MBT1152778.1 glycerophosphodiester phosphodiesterase [Lactiplantibacillus argentoratensis]ABJ63289.1 Membrane domain of membrane-anchored glycerophosphoryl diester phosphodiesterase [Levilactobacillus brevis ATCC 367]AJA80329.1 glycerophosphoryl diester phosphodiesteras